VRSRCSGSPRLTFRGSHAAVWTIYRGGGGYAFAAELRVSAARCVATTSRVFRGRRHPAAVNLPLAPRSTCRRRGDSRRR
jgi:hypothetical protein